MTDQKQHKNNSSGSYFIIVAGLLGLFVSISKFEQYTIVSLIKIGIPLILVVWGLFLVIKDFKRKE